MAPSLAELRRALARRSRWLTAVFVAAAVAFGLSAVAPRPKPGVAVLVASHDLASGVALQPGDIRVVHLDRANVPTGSVAPGARVLGRVVAAPMRRGEPLTDLRLLGRPLLAAIGRGLVAAPVRLADAQAAALLHPGDHVDVLASPQSPDGVSPTPTTSPGTGPVVAAQDVDVLAVPPADGSGDGALVVLAVPSRTAAALAQLGGGYRLSVTVQP